jgi:sugar phosphate isomerase/epimerase
MAIPLAVQLIVFGQAYKLNNPSDAVTVLDAVRSSGFTAVEGSSDDAEGFRKLLDERSLRCSALHVALSSGINAKELVKKLKILGATHCLNSGVLRWNDRDEACYRESARQLNEAGRILKSEGIGFHYHNHDFEFTETFSGKTGFDILQEDLDPSAMDLGIDVAWIKKGGLDPVTFLRTHRERISYLHLKDYTKDGWTELGTGEVPLADVIATLPELPNLRWVAAEQDRCVGDPADSVRISRDWLRGRAGW